MALQTDLAPPLLEKVIVFAAVRTMAFHAPRALQCIGVGDGVFVRKRPALFRMTILTDSIEIIGVVVVRSPGKTVATQAGDIALKERVIGTAPK